jgi:hypothetical protein
MDSSDGISTMRLYGATIAVVSGLYSGYLSVTGAEMSLGAWFMLGLGTIVLIHGLVLVTPAADRLGTASGPLMLAYSALMLLNQLRLAAGVGTTGGTGGMDGSMGGMAGMNDAGMGSTMAAMGADAGMVAVAVLMLASGLIMTVRADMMDAGE